MRKQFAGPGLKGLAAAMLVLALLLSAGYGEEEALPRRALPPKWSRDVLDTFFRDVREALQGERPDYAALAKGRNPAGEPGEPTHADGAPTGRDGFHWSELIRAETIEDEVKRIGQSLAEHVATPSEFKGGAYRACRRDLSLLAVLFAIAGEYDAAVRWREDAPTYRDLFARAGFNCKVGTDQSLREALLRFEDLQNIVRGSRVEGPDAGREASWPQTADRDPLMSRMEMAYEERLSKWLASPGAFRGNLAQARHEAEMLAALAEVIAREGYEYAEEAEYAAFASQVRDSAREIADAASAEDYARATEAAGRLEKSCADCHEGYRA